MKPVNTLNQCLNYFLWWNFMQILWLSTLFHCLTYCSLLFSVSSSEMRSISDRIPSSPLRVPASPSRFSLSSPPSRNDPLNLSLETVIKLTRNFSPALMIGESYFGKAYRMDLQNGLVVAIKRARKVVFSSSGNCTRDLYKYNDWTIIVYSGCFNSTLLGLTKSLIRHDTWGLEVLLYSSLAFLV